MLENNQLPEPLSFTMGDVIGQRKIRLSDLPEGITVAELIAGVIGPMGLPRNDAAGRPLTYRARSTREGRHLGPDESVYDVVHPGDDLSVHPNVDAGGGRDGDHGARH